MTIIGTEGTPGHTAFVALLIAPIKSSRIGDGGLLRGVPTTLRCTAVSATTFVNCAVTKPIESSGRTRQLTVAAASCGSALIACPPSSIVATQVVRSVAFHGVDPDATRVIAAASPFATAARSDFTAPFSMPDIARKY